MRKDKFKFGFLAFLMVMNVYWSYYPPSEKYLSHTILDSKYTQRSLYKRVLVINALVLICLIIEFWYFCDHGIRGQEYAMYISIIGMASANRCLAFALQPDQCLLLEQNLKIHILADNSSHIPVDHHLLLQKDEDSDSTKGWTKSCSVTEQT